MNENNNKHIKTDDDGIKVIEVKSEKELWQHIMEEQKRSTEEFYLKQTENDRKLIVNLINEIKASGCDNITSPFELHYMLEEEVSVYPIVMKYINKFDNVRISIQLFSELRLRNAYKQVPELVPFLLECLKRKPLEDKKEEHSYKERICEALYNIRCKDFVEEYISIIKNAQNQNNLFFLIQLVGWCKREKDIQFLLNLLKSNDYEIVSAALYALFYYKGHNELLPYLQEVEDRVKNKELIVDDPKWFIKHHIEKTRKRLSWEKGIQT